MLGFAKNEIFIVFNNRKLWLIMLGLLLLNMGIVLISFSMDEINPSEYKRVKQEAESQPDIILDNYMNDMGSPVYKRLFDEYMSVQEYGMYIQEVMDNADEGSRVSIFQDDFSKKNFKKTKQDYSEFSGILPEFVGSYGLERALSFFASDIIVMVVIIIVVNILIMQDKKSGMLNLLKATRYGDGRLILIKALSALLYICLFGIVVYIANIGMAIELYGKVSMRVPLQSMLAYSKTAVTGNIGSFIVSVGIHKIFIYGILTVLAVLITTLSSNEVIMYVLIGILCVVEFFVYAMGKLMNNMVLKRMTIVNMLNPQEFYKYYNYNIFTKPISALFVDTLVFSVLIIVLLWLCTYIFARKELEYRSVARYRSKGKKDGIHGLIMLDGYKFLFGYKVVAVLMVVLMFQVAVYKDKHAGWNENELYYRYYMKQIEGEITDDKIDFINSEVIRMQELRDDTSALSEEYNNGNILYEEYEQLTQPMFLELKKEGAILRCKKYVDYILSRSERDVEFVYDRGWNYIFGNDTYKNDVKNAVVVMLAVLIAVAFMYGEEYRYGMDKLINISAKYKKLKVIKAFIVLCYIFVMFSMIYLTEFVWAGKEFGFTNGNANCVSLMRLSVVGTNMSIWGYCVVMYLIRFVAICLISIITACVCKLMKNSNYTVILLSLIVILPLLLNLLGIHGFDNYSFNSYLSANMLLQKF